MAASMASQAQLGMIAEVTAGTPVTVTERYEFASESMSMNESLLDTSGILGTRSHMSERVRANIQRVSGSITLYPNSVELVNLLPRILGGAASGTSFPLADTLPPFTVNVDRVTARWVYGGCFVNRATFASRQGEPLTLTLEIEAMNEQTPSATVFPTLSISLVGPYIHSDAQSGSTSALTISGTAYRFREWSLTIDNHLDTERFFNSVTRISIPAMDRTVTWTFAGPYGDNSALYGLASTGVACVATFTNGNYSIAFTSNKVAFPRLSPPAQGKEEIFLSLVGQARSDGSTKELTTVNDSTG